jgi:glycosyltransferase involved in cell wall biosynthesis
MAEGPVLKRIRRYLQRFQSVLWCREAIMAVRGVGRKFRGGVVSLRAVGAAKGSVLISYNNEGFLYKQRGEVVPISHPSFYKTMVMAQTFLDLGYDVDVIHCENQRFIPWKPYDVVVDVRFNLQRLKPYLPETCIKIFHCDTAQAVFQNVAEMNRMLAFQQRKGVTVPANRLETPHLGIDHAQYLTTCGNDFTINTYAYSGKPIFRLPSITQTTWPWFENKDLEACRHRFLWYGSRGMIHKGLDLVLEAFTQLPDCHLTVVGPVLNEPEFATAYHNELFHTPNIRCVGWLDNSSDQFRNILEQSIAHVFCSCSEAGAAAVIETMAAGVIPVVTYEASVDVEDYGVLIKDVSIETIIQGIRSIAGMSGDELRRRSRNAWETATAKHRPEQFERAYRTTIETILARHGKMASRKDRDPSDRPNDSVRDLYTSGKPDLSAHEGRSNA